MAFDSGGPAYVKESRGHALKRCLVQTVLTFAREPGKNPYDDNNHACSD